MLAMALRGYVTSLPRERFKPRAFISFVNSSGCTACSSCSCLRNPFEVSTSIMFGCSVVTIGHSFGFDARLDDLGVSIRCCRFLDHVICAVSSWRGRNDNLFANPL